MQPELKALQARCDELESEVAVLRRALGMEKRTDMQQALAVRWRFTGREADFVWALYVARNRTLTKGGLMDVLYQDSPDEPEMKILDVWACKIRRKTAPEFLETFRGGYRLSGRAVDEISSLVGGVQ